MRPAHLLLSLLLLATDSLRAQIGGFFSLGEGQPFAKPRYLAESAPVGSAAWSAQFNSLGAQRALYLAPFVFGDPTAPPNLLNLFLTGTSGETTTFTYEFLTTPPSGPSLLTQLNSQGSRGYRFYAPLATTLGDLSDIENPIYPEQRIAYLRPSIDPGTYEYSLAPAHVSASAFLSITNSMGDQGWRYITLLASNGGQTPPPTDPIIESLFVRRIGSASKYSYELGPKQASTSAALLQINSQGSRQFRYLGSISFGTFPALDFREVYAKDTGSPVNYTVEALPYQSTPVGIISQADAQGTRGFTYMFPANLGDPATGLAGTTNLYLSEEPIGGTSGHTIPIGCLDLKPNGEITYLIKATFARFQLQCSTTLSPASSWTNFGATQTGTIGTTLRWQIDPTTAPRRFYRVCGLNP